MGKNLSASEHRLGRIFSDEYVFTIPGYQRPYAWQNEQTRELFDDIVEYKKIAPVSDDQVAPYFLGSIVLIKQEAEPRAEIIDGQQRLTTLTLLLACIRSVIAPGHAADVSVLIYEKGNKIRGTEDRYRLTLRERDAEFFQNYVQKEGGVQKLVTLETKLSDSQRNLRDNARYLLDRLGVMSQADIVEFAQFLVKHSCLVVVSTQDLDAAYRIFSVLNSRGLDLAATDILKAKILGGVTPSMVDQYTQKWEESEEDLGREAFDDMFGHIRMIYRKAKPQGTLVKEFTEHVPSISEPTKFIDNILIPMSETYREILDANFGTAPAANPINENLTWLNRIEFSDWLPPALLHLNTNRSISPTIVRFFSDLERLTYGLLLMKAGINERIDRFSKVTGAIESGADLFDVKSPLQLTAGEQFLIYQQLNGPIYESLGSRARSIVLLRLDALLADAGATYDHDIITVEHVYPQTPEQDSEWIQWIPDERIREVCVHRLGNLALLNQRANSAAKNYKFGRKKTAYFARNGVSPFALTTQVLGETVWDAPTIERRQSLLMGILERHWQLQGRVDPLEGLSNRLR